MYFNLYFKKKKLKYRHVPLHNWMTRFEAGVTGSPRDAPEMPLKSGINFALESEWAYIRVSLYSGFYSIKRFLI